MNDARLKEIEGHLACGRETPDMVEELIAEIRERGAYIFAFETESVMRTNSRIAELEAALEFYCYETNFKIVDEGRDYNTKNVLYEEDPQTYIEMPFGKIAREVLAKKGTP